MARIAVLGAGVCGLAAAMMLARDGHEVIVLERDAEPARSSIEEAWESWERGGVVQFRQPHYLQAAARRVLDTELPDVRDALAAAGALSFNSLESMPPTVEDREARAGDERFVTLTARRPTIEHVFARAAEAEPGVEVRRGAAATGLLTGAPASTAAPHVAGVRTAAGEELRADLVVDAMGRRSPLPDWLSAIGAHPLHEEAEDSGFIYYSRFFRAGAGGGAPRPRTVLLSPVGSFTILTLPADRETWSVTLFISSRDQALKQLRHADRWTSVVSACPLHAHWLDGEPITGVLPMSGVMDRYRRIVVNGRPVATGLALVGDAWACTNPSLGRGVALGLRHASYLPGVVRGHLEDPLGFAEAWDAETESQLTPWYRATVATDRARLAEIDALREGRAPSPPATPASTSAAALAKSMRHDPDVFRAFMEIVGCLTLPGEIFARPGFADRVMKVASEHDAPPLAGPAREALLRLIA